METLVTLVVVVLLLVGVILGLVILRVLFPVVMEVVQTLDMVVLLEHFQMLMPILVVEVLEVMDHPVKMAPTVDLVLF